MGDKIKENDDMPVIKKHMVLYVDGSGKIDIEAMGTGIHGYVYNDDGKDKKSGDRPKKYTITNKGYLENGNSDNESYTVLPEAYVDGIITNIKGGTSNRAELDGIIYAIKIALEYEHGDISTLLIKSDSAYAIGCAYKAKSVDRNEWNLNTTKNLDKYLVLEDLFKMAKDKGMLISINKVLGHSTSLGNHLADRLAFLARNNSYKYRTFNVDVHITKGKYWSYKEEIHPMINFKQLFFMNGIGASDSYCIMDYKKDDVIGKPINNAAFGLVKLKEPVDRISNIINSYNNYLNTLSLIAGIDLKVLYSQRALMYSNLFGNDIFIPNNKGRKYLTVLEEDIVCSEVYPPGLAKVTLDKTMLLRNIMEDYTDGSKTFKYIDITDKIYGVDTKGKPTTLIDGNVKHLDVEIPDVCKLPIMLGTETLTRNQFKKLEKTNTKVYLVYMPVSDKGLEYWTLVDSDGSIGIYTNYYTNKFFI